MEGSNLPSIGERLRIPSAKALRWLLLTVLVAGMLSFGFPRLVNDCCALSELINPDRVCRKAILSPQTISNLTFVAAPTIRRALKGKHQWPPAYPLLLRAGVSVGLGPRVVGKLLLFATLICVGVLARRVSPRIHPAIVVGIYGVGHFHSEVLNQSVSEVMLVPLVLGVALVLPSYLNDDSRLRFLGLAGLLGLAYSTRYFSIFWLAPIVFTIEVLATRPLARGLRRATLLSLVSMLPVGLWMAKLRAATGFITGIDRVRDRRFEHLTDFSHNVAFTVKTFFIDWFSASREAHHFEIEPPYSATPTETIVALVLAIACAVVLYDFRDRIIASIRSASEIMSSLPTKVSSQTSIVMVLAFSYPVILVLLWSVGNNDPVYSRFLYPSYVFGVLALAAGYSSCDDSNNRRSKIAISMTLMIFVGIQVYKGVTHCVV